MKLQTALASAAALALSLSSAQAQEKTLTISVYAFAQDEFKELVYDPFQARCGCKLVVETGNSVERLAKMEANKSKPVIDMAVVSMADALQASRAGLIDTIDTAKLTNYDKLYDIAKDPNGDGMSVGYTFYATSIVYRTDKMKIESWADLLKDDVVSHIAFPNVTTNQGPPALYMLGIALGQDTPDLKGAIEAVGAKRDEIVTFYVKSSQLVQLMQQEEIWAAPIGRFSWAPFAKLDLPLAWATPKEGQTGGMNVMVVTKGSQNRDLALEFMDFWLSTEVQTKLAEKLVDSPANAEVRVSDEVAQNITYGEETVKNLKLIPSSIALDNRDGWLSDWNAKVGQ
ncbi:ABC transporter substrate-binding protein [Haematobacter missouriensis]|uniref:ABC transporter substrate-binding protein n=1 Tax=Haematobacter missouriensis TaxID=366616 RepID=A0A212AHT8_9RHOB|nr:ABC transporter substrate-binding protein [Haematobacter missouriensis]KFI25413.1 ABC transporter substrate-binding protein [Haematobacter missouriensis]OWJ72022.1 ABC transporter substrate-binding protein [Haematobacter missouriensis]OWJ81061.1 ABC transporter substrate-binding protein [Haematobacter missouriensis]